MKFKNIFLWFLIAFLLVSCSSIDKMQAESKAVDFVKKNVKFFARDENSTEDLQKYSIDGVTSYPEGKNWVVAMHVSSFVGNLTKNNDLVVKVDRGGKVIEFNGKKVPG